ncbi:MAG: SDR family oxidoreductase [Mycobacteriales bacterium]
MILVAGGTGSLGREVVGLLLARGEQVRVLTRQTPASAGFAGDVEVAQGDVRDAGSLTSATAGIDLVISAVQGFAGRDASSPSAVDATGNANLVRAAQASGVKHFVLISMYGAAMSAWMDLARAKYAAEQAVRASAMAWTIIRPTAFMETWAQIVGAPLLQTGRTRVFGRGNNAINFVSMHDVAKLVDLVSADTGLRGTTLDIAGPQDLTMNDVVALFAARRRDTPRISHVPLPLMRLASVLLRPVAGPIARQIAAGVVMDTADLTFTGTDVRQQIAGLPQTGFVDVVGRLPVGADAGESRP